MESVLLLRDTRSKYRIQIIIISISQYVSNVLKKKKLKIQNG